jgi:CheY-like chemotaxis protein
MEQVILNLAVNARDAMPDGGRLTIETTNVDIQGAHLATHLLAPPGNYTMLAVTDTGTGMSAEVKARIFEPFFTTKGQGKGTGLGLAMVYGIVKQSGGFIWVYSELGKGTTFKIYLPKHESGECLAPRECATPAQSPYKRGMILLVEDEETLRDVVTDFLRSGGHTVIAAGNLDEACRLALENRQKIDLLLTDVILKGGNAKQLVHRLEAQQCAFRVVYMSGYTSDAIVRHGVLDPGVLFLQKPFSRTALLDKVEEALSSGSAGPIGAVA